MYKTTKETYNYVFKRDNGRCRICTSQVGLELHHIEGRGRKKTNDANNCIMLCRICHRMVHENNKFWRKELLKENERYYKHNPNATIENNTNDSSDIDNDN